jgi:hypothetical protein
MSVVRPDQVMEVCPALENGQFGCVLVSGEQGHGQQLAHQVLDPTLVHSGFSGMNRSPGPTRRSRAASWASYSLREPARWIEDGELGQRLGVDAVRLGVAREIATSGQPSVVDPPPESLT